MLNNLINGQNNVFVVLGTAFFIGIFIYIIIYSILQVRQIGLLRNKIQTDGDLFIKIGTYLYLLIQIIIFMFALFYMI